jgi:magnesium-protoporphyrin O-methyltransferase
MSTCCAPFEETADRHFNREKAAAELKRHRDKGPGATARLLAAGIAETGTVAGSMLDIGAGIGDLTFAMLARGMASAIAVDASSAYLDAARQEAERLGCADVVRFVHADFVATASELPAATLVTLDRVVCCYPSYEPLLHAALRHADRCVALSYSHEVWYVRMGMRFENGLRQLRRNSFRTYVHPAAKMEQLIRQAGFALSGRRETWVWSVDVYTR